MRTHAFIDASNLTYGGRKSLGWSIDYAKFFSYLRDKYAAEKICYFGGVEILRFPFDYLTQETVPIRELEAYFTDLAEELDDPLNRAKRSRLRKHLKRVRFYQTLEEIGYDLVLKPIKIHSRKDGFVERKANCDVDVSFYLMRYMDEFDRAVVVSGDGDFLPVLKYLQNKGREVIVLARNDRTAREIKQFAGGNFRDFHYLRELLRQEEHEEI